MNNSGMIKMLSGFTFSLAHKKAGALMVIAQEESLRDYIESGVYIDSEISAELLGAIFENKSPLHDGAVLIDKNRLIAASCLLPTNTDQKIRGMGTRHKAALALAEQTDAVIIVVSEEKGIVSVARRSNLERDITQDRLELILSQSLNNNLTK